MLRQCYKPFKAGVFDAGGGNAGGITWLGRSHCKYVEGATSGACHINSNDLDTPSITFKGFSQHFGASRPHNFDVNYYYGNIEPGECITTGPYNPF